MVENEGVVSRKRKRNASTCALRCENVLRQVLRLRIDVISRFTLLYSSVSSWEHVSPSGLSRRHSSLLKLSSLLTYSERAPE